MCGIFGTVNFGPLTDERLVFDGLRHRGPDQQGKFTLHNVSLYHTRLAIQDLSTAGQQPMTYKGLVIVFNGEIYNHLELRIKYNLRAASNSDTLTVLMLFELLGMQMLEEFDGMFAFALFDSDHGKLYLARDRAGKKPLYIYQKNSTCVFASELNVLRKVAQPETDHNALADYLYLGHHYRKATPYLLVEELEHGHYMELNTRSGSRVMVMWFSIARYYNRPLAISRHDATDRLDELLHTAVKRRIDSSDLAVGSFLSGGIDSGLVSAIAASHTTRLKTFTVKVKGAFDESELAALVAAQYDTDHHTVEIDFSTLSDDIEQILINYGEPVSDNSVIPSYYVAREAKKRITVALNGDGADELFGGYRRYVPFKHFDFFNPTAPARISAGILAALLPAAREKQSLYTYFYRLVRFASHADPVIIYCSASSDLMAGFEWAFLHEPPMKDFRADLLKISGYPLSPLKKILLMDFESMLCGRLLPKMDIATMAHSLEGRSPFLSRELLEFAPGLPDQYKIRYIRTKEILRDLAKRYLPATVVSQPKRGFEIPLAQWVDHELREIMAAYLLSSDTLFAGILRRSFIEDLLRGKIYISAEQRAKILFSVFSLEVWYKNLHK